MYEVVITHSLAVITEKPPVITVGAYVATAVITEEKNGLCQPVMTEIRVHR